jgi:hypothetical protein
MTSLTAPFAWWSALNAKTSCRTIRSISFVIAEGNGNTKDALVGSIAPATTAFRTIGCSSEGWYDTSYQPSDEQPIFLEVKCVMMKDVKELYDQIQARNGWGG